MLLTETQALLTFSIQNIALDYIEAQNDKNFWVEINFVPRYHALLIRANRSVHKTLNASDPKTAILMQ